MIISSKAYGRIEISDESLINLPYGLPSFDNLTKWALFAAQEKPFYILQSLEKSDVAFFLLTPLFFSSDYQLEIDVNDANLLGLAGRIDEARVFIIINIPHNTPHQLTGNLQAPLVINDRDKIAGQCLSLNGKWQLRHYLLGSPLASEVV
jgi:flagellar assembly factor FliW